jgi:hypothetical protein
VVFEYEVPESDYLGRVTSTVPQTAWPTANGQSNFAPEGSPYMKFDYQPEGSPNRTGIVVLMPTGVWQLYERDGASDPPAVIHVPPPAQPSGDPAYANNVTVSNVYELAAAIADDTCITLKAGVYDMSAIAYGQVFGAYRDYQVALAIIGVEKLALRAEEGAKVVIVTNDRFSEVIYLRACADVTLRGITVGHTVKSPEYECEASVVLFEGCTDITVENCYFYGCGSVGIIMLDCVSASIKDTTITDCSLRGVELLRSTDISFTGCKYIDNRAYADVILVDGGSVVFTGCEISGNRNLQWAVVSPGFYADVLFDGCVFKGNAPAEGYAAQVGDDGETVYMPIFDGENVKLKNCTIETAGFLGRHDRGTIDLGGNDWVSAAMGG